MCKTQDRLTDYARQVAILKAPSGATVKEIGIATEIEKGKILIAVKNYKK